MIDVEPPAAALSVKIGVRSIMISVLRDRLSASMCRGRLK